MSRVLALVLLIVAAALPARAADRFDELIAKLGTDGFAEKIAAAQALGELGDGRAIAPLRALAEGRLYVRPSDKQIVVIEPGAAPAAGLDKVRINNRLRNVIGASLSNLMLFSPERGDRLAAAREAFSNDTAGIMALLERALGSEKDAEVREAMRFSLLAAKLRAGSDADRIAAVTGLSGSVDPKVMNLLSSLKSDANASPELRAAIDGALAASDTMRRIIAFAESLFQGVSLGSVLLLAAIGLAITFGVMGVINMAHGEMIMIGAYATYMVQELFRAWLPPSLFGWYVPAALPVAFVVAGAFGIAIEQAVIRWLYSRPLETLLATWGVSLILQQLVRSVFGAPNKEVANPGWMTGGTEIAGGFLATYNRIYIIVFCFLFLVGIAALLHRTAFGLHMRAVTQNRDMARAMGIPTGRIDALTFGLGSGIAGVAGVALSQIGNVSPNLGQIYIVDSFLVVVFGGVGNLWGTLVGAMTLGIVNKFLEPVAGAVLGKVVVLVAIILFIQKRPRGLFALKGRAAEA